MVKHAIVLADEDWCRAATSGKVKVYDFKKSRKKGIYSLGPGSVCIVLVKKEQYFCGEFTVKEVRKVDANEYNSLASKGIIHNPQSVGSGERVWVLLFDEFKEYKKKVYKDDLYDVKTSTSREPISKWVITGLSYIDDVALEGIRRKAEGVTPPPQPAKETHECIELRLIELGEMLGFKTYTSDESKKCGDMELGSKTTLKREDLSYDKLKTIDVVWYKHPYFKLFEVVLTTDMRSSLVKFIEVADLNAEYFIIALSTDKNRFERALTSAAFDKIRDRTKFISTEELSKIYETTTQWRKIINILNLPYL
jgi:hypothetical protein